MFDGVSLKNWKGGDGWWELRTASCRLKFYRKAVQKNSHLIYTASQPLTLNCAPV